jgi:hypothetical protein
LLQCVQRTPAPLFFAAWLCCRQCTYTTVPRAAEGTLARACQAAGSDGQAAGSDRRCLCQ